MATPTDITERFHSLVQHLAAEFSSGQTSISDEDVLADGRLVADEVAAMITAAARRPDEFKDCGETIQALRTMSDVWGSGFDLASGADYLYDEGEATVAGAVTAYADELRAGAPRP